MTSASPFRHYHPLMPTLMPKPAAPRPPGSWTSSSYLSRQVVGKADRVRHMAAPQGSTSWGERRRAPVGSRSARRQRIAADNTLALGLSLSGCTPGAGEPAAFIPSEGAGRAGCSPPTNARAALSAAEAGAGPGAHPVGRRPRTAPPPACSLHPGGGALEAALLRADGGSRGDSRREVTWR